MLELLHAVTFIRQQGNAKRADALRQLAEDFRQCRFALRGDKDALALREVVANDVCNRMSLAGSGRSLHDNAVAVFQLANDRNLFFVISHREIQLESIRWAVARRQPTE